MLIYDFNLKYFKLIKRFGLLTYGINIVIAGEIICDGNKRIKPINGPYIKGTTYVSVNNL
jgi:hypothetical protein